MNENAKLRNQKLLTKKIAAKIPALFSTEAVPLSEKPVYVKFFSPYGRWTWYAVEGSPVLDPESDAVIDFEFFGWVEGFENEAGSFCLSEMEECTQKLFGQTVASVERDSHVDESYTLSQLTKKLPSWAYPKAEQEAIDQFEEAS